MYPTEELCILTVCYRLQSRVLQTPVECVSRQAGSASGFWKEDVAVLLLTSVAGIVLCCASQGFCSIIGAHFITLFSGGVCALAAEPSALNFSVAQGFVFFCIYSSACAV